MSNRIIASLGVLAACHPSAPRQPPAPSAVAAAPITQALRAPWEAMRLARVVDREVVVTDRSGDPQTVPAAPSGFVQWSARGDAVYVAGDGAIVRCPIAPAGPCKTVATEPLPLRFAVSPDGAWIHVVPRTGKGSFVVNTATQKRDPMPAAESAVWLGSDRIAYLTTKSIHAWDLKQHRDHVLGERPDVAELVSLTPSPDGRWLAVVGRRTEQRPAGIIDSHYGVGVFDPAAKVWGPYFDASTPHGKDARGNTPPVWSPDSRRLVYIDRDAKLALLDLAIASRVGPRALVAPHVAPVVLEERAERMLGWLDGLRIAYMRIDHIDDSEVRQFGHGVVPAFCDVVVFDLATSTETPLTDGGALDGCAAAFTRTPV